MSAPTRPILRYHGGKWRLAPWIISRMPPHRVYVEPFCGAASVLMRKPRSYAEVINDLDGEILNVFRIIREQPAMMKRLLARTPFARAEYELAFEPTDDPVELARRTIVRSFMGFGSNSINRAVKSGFRANAWRNGTTPAMDWAGLPRNLVRFAARLRGVVIEQGDAVDLIRRHDGVGALIYCDPPYVASTRNPFVKGNLKGYHHEMTDGDHERLAEALHQVNGMVMLSGYHSPLYDRLYAGWHREERDALGDGACKRVEVLWFNAAAQKALKADAHGLFV